jgi:alpha-beta hydrolase superfamily lysophospholipase
MRQASDTVFVDRARGVAAAIAVAACATSTTSAAGRAVNFAASDGTQLSATLYDSSNRPAPAVILVHMLGRSRDDWDNVASRLADAGLVVLAIDLRGHGRSSGANAGVAVMLPPMVDDVRAAVTWIGGRPNVTPGGIAIAGASLGANLAALAAADSSQVRAVALLSPSLDYRGIRIDAGVIKKIGARPMWLAASTHDPYALRTLKELATEAGPREQYLSRAPAHGTNLLAADADLARSLVDWLKRTLIF